MAVTSPTLLTEPLLETFRARAAGYDRDNKFCQEDFDDLKAAGYLKMAVPREFGGLGMTLAEVGRETRRLATYAAPTALCVNMHNYWVGTAADVWRSGDKSVQWILEEAAAGEVFAAGHAEPGNETSVVMSLTKAERVDGGYRFTGRKAFGSLSPVWTRLGLHGIDTSDPSAPKIVHAFLPRNASGYRISETWDVMGMRATRSDDTILEGAFVPDNHIARVLPAGLAGADHFVLSIFAWALTNFAQIYYGLASRMLALTIGHVKSKGSPLLTGSMAHHPEVQHNVAAMVMEMEAIAAQIDTTQREWSDGVDYGMGWAIKIVGTKYRAVEGAWRVADLAMETSGGFGMFKKSELERLYRDARAGRFHPANSALSHELIGKIALGIDPDAMPRWG